jgi:hypothetical protein
MLSSGAATRSLGDRWASPNATFAAEWRRRLAGRPASRPHRGARHGSMSTGWASERLSGARRRSVSREGGAIRYLCPIYDDETRLAARSQTEAGAFMGSMSPSGRRRKSGHYLGREALDSVQTATTVRVRRHKVSTTDGPFAENEGAAGRLLSQGSERGDLARRSNPAGAPGKRGGPAGPGVRPAIDPRGHGQGEASEKRLAHWVMIPGGEGS